MSRALICFCLLLAGLAWAQPTPPIQPNLREVTLPAPLELAGPPNPVTDLPNRALTAEEAVAVALRSSPSLSVAAAGVSGSAARTQQSRAGLHPTVAVGSSYAHVDSNAGSTSSVSGTEGYQVSVSLKQLVYDFNHTRDLVREAQAQERSASANLTRAQLDLILQVKVAFYVYLQNTRLVDVAQANVSNQQVHLDLAQARLKSGLGLPMDVVRAEAAYADAVYGLTAARNGALQARVNLAELMGIDPRTPMTAADTGEPQVGFGSVNELVDRALAQRPEMLQTQAQIEAAQYGIRAAQSSNSPTVVGTAGVQQRGSDFPPDDNTLSVGVALQWTPFDSGLTAGRIKEAQANLQTLQAQLASVRLAVVSDVSAAYLNLKSAEQRVATSEAGVVNAREALRLAQERYRVGIGVFLDVLDAQTALDTANTNYVNSLSSLDQARVALVHATGKDATSAH